MEYLLMSGRIMSEKNLTKSFLGFDGSRVSHCSYSVLCAFDKS